MSDVNSPQSSSDQLVGARLRSAAGRRRLFALLLLLAVLGGLYSCLQDRLRAWRPSLDQAESPAPPQGDAASVPASGTPAPQSVATDAGRPSNSSAQADTGGIPPVFGELPAESDARLRFLREEAFQVAARLVTDLPRQPSAVALLAVAHERFGQSDAAEKCWQDCLQLQPRFAEAWAGLGKIAHERGDDQSAATHFREALKLNPQLPDLRPALADAWLAQGQIREAAELLEEDVRQFPAATGSWYRLGQAYLQLGEYEQAARGFEAAVRVDSQCTYAYYGLANARRRLGQAEEFTRHMRTFKQLKEQDLQTQRDKTRRFDDEGELRRTAAFVHAGAGRVYAEQGYPAKAERHWQRAVQISPQEILARQLLARLYERQDELPQVVQMLQELRALEPRNPLHCLSLGVAQRRLQALPAAEQAFRDAIELAPQNPVGYVALADFYMRTGLKLAEARQAAERAVELEPTAPNYAVLCAACRQSGAPADALRAIERALELAPANPQFRQLREHLQQQVQAAREPRN